MEHELRHLALDHFYQDRPVLEMEAEADGIPVQENRTPDIPPPAPPVKPVSKAPRITAFKSQQPPEYQAKAPTADYFSSWHKAIAWSKDMIRSGQVSV